MWERVLRFLVELFGQEAHKLATNRNCSMTKRKDRQTDRETGGQTGRWTDGHSNETATWQLGGERSRGVAEAINPGPRSH